jgi:hypothetical protein
LGQGGDGASGHEKSGAEGSAHARSLAFAQVSAMRLAA